MTERGLQSASEDWLLTRLRLGLQTGLDDTIVRKTGKKIHGNARKRDPRGPAFQTNLVLAQRDLQLSVAWPLDNGEAQVRTAA